MIRGLDMKHEFKSMSNKDIADNRSAAYKFLPIDLQDKSMNWEEDFKLENGMYQNLCSVCNKFFVGHKHREVCKKCNKKL